MWLSIDPIKRFAYRTRCDNWVSINGDDLSLNSVKFSESWNITETWIKNLKILSITYDLVAEWLRCWPLEVTWSNSFWFLIFLSLNQLNLVKKSLGENSVVTYWSIWHTLVGWKNYVANESSIGGRITVKVCLPYQWHGNGPIDPIDKNNMLHRMAVMIKKKVDPGIDAN